MRVENEEKAEISANCRVFQESSSNHQESSCGLLARGVGFEPTRPFLTTDLAGLPPTRLGQPRKGNYTSFLRLFLCSWLA